MNSNSPNNVWLISREYDGVAEAGGVKNVVCSMAEELSKGGINTTVLIPRYACSSFKNISDYKPNCIPPQIVSIANRDYTVSFDSGKLFNGVNIVFVVHQIFLEKEAVYTYTYEEEKRCCEHKRGIGHFDSLLMNVLFQKAVLSYGCYKEIIVPDIIHCHDAATALIPPMAKCLDVFQNKFNNTKFVVTIHNAGPGYHHEFYNNHQALELTGLPVDLIEYANNNGTIEPFLLTIPFSGLTTVSPWYADEILDSNNHDTGGLSVKFVEKNCTIKGITNGISCEKYNPTDTSVSLLPFAFDPLKRDFSGKYFNRQYFLGKYASKDSSLENFTGLTRFGGIEVEDNDKHIYLCYHGRIVRQKGIDILSGAIENLLKECLDVRVILVGQGEVCLEEELARVATENKGRCLYLRGYDRAVTRLATAISDFIILPSKFEPCGLEDFISQMYGTIPIAHATGGLNKILDGKTGFLYKDNESDVLFDVLRKIVSDFKTNRTKFENIMSYAYEYVSEKYSWKNVISNEYIPYYNSL